jgi:hypothetical protein
VGASVGVVVPVGEEVEVEVEAAEVVEVEVAVVEEVVAEVEEVVQRVTHKDLPVGQNAREPDQTALVEPQGPKAQLEL